MMDKDRTVGYASGSESRADKVKRDASEKQKRLAEALRVNLHRRKAQSRARTDAGDPIVDDAGTEQQDRDGPPSRS